MSTGSMGQAVLHAALTEARQARATIARFLNQLQIPEGEAAAKPNLKPQRLEKVG
jgi:hypothetical protein